MLAKTMPFSLQAARSFTAPVCPQRYYRLVRCMRHFSPAEVSSSCLLIQLSRCSYSAANHPGGLLPCGEFTLRDCCAIMATIGVYFFRCRLLNGSNLRFLFVWRIYKIYFRNNHCRIEDQKMSELIKDRPLAYSFIEDGNLHSLIKWPFMEEVSVFQPVGKSLVDFIRFDRDFMQSASTAARR